MLIQLFSNFLKPFLPTKSHTENQYVKALCNKDALVPETYLVTPRPLLSSLPTLSSGKPQGIADETLLFKDYWFK